MWEWINKFGALFALATSIVLAGVYLYSIARKGRQDVLRQDNADLRASNQELRTERAADQAKILEQQESIRYLKDVATQTPAVKQLIEMNMRQSKQSAEQHTQVIKELSGVANEIGHLAGEFAQLAKVLNVRYNGGKDDIQP